MGVYALAMRVDGVYAAHEEAPVFRELGN